MPTLRGTPCRQRQAEWIGTLSRLFLETDSMDICTRYGYGLALRLVGKALLDLSHESLQQAAAAQELMEVGCESYH
jgi:hypothetical protein